MKNNKRSTERHYNYSSSQVSRLMANGKAKGSIGAPFYTYVSEKIREKRLGKQINKEQFSYPTLWGHFAERYAFDKLGLEYHLQSKVRYLHDELDWSGAPDLIKDISVGDIKCPWTLAAFTKMVDDLEETNDMEELIAVMRKNYPEYYWQLVSNSILADKESCELILYCPYEDDLLKMQLDITNSEEDLFDGEDMYKYKFIYDKNLEELPCLKKGLYYKDLYKFDFTPPEEDKLKLYSRVKEATQTLRGARYEAQ